MPHTVYHVNRFRCATLLHNTLQPHTAKLKARNFTKSNTTPWVFFTFFKLHKWHQIAQNITDVNVTCIDIPRCLMTNLMLSAYFLLCKIF